MPDDADAPTGGQADVVVVGGGPVGMTVAGDLARLGRSVVVLERSRSVAAGSRAIVTMPRTLEVLDARGLADDLLAIGATAPAVPLFAGTEVDFTGVGSRYRHALITSQVDVDRALAAYAVEQGAVVLRGVEVVGLGQDGTGVTVSARADEGERARTSTWYARCAVGADGSRSTVRRLLGTDFPGRTLLPSIVVADVRLGEEPGTIVLSSGFLVPYGRRDAKGSWFRAMTWNCDDESVGAAPLDDGEVITLLHRTIGTDLDIDEVGWSARIDCDERQVPQYRSGRVFLVGDAAQVHSPTGGQGLNLGIQDAANLSWKLDAALGGARDAVLDSYHDERHPVGRQVARRSRAMMRTAMSSRQQRRLMRTVVRPALLAMSPTNTGDLAGTTQRYPRRRSDNPLVGRRATEVPLREGRLTELQRQPGFVLIRDRESAATAEHSVIEAQRTDDGPALLVRPDGYLAWAGSVQEGSWREVLARWGST